MLEALKTLWVYKFFGSEDVGLKFFFRVVCFVTVYGVTELMRECNTVVDEAQARTYDDGVVFGYP